MAGDGLAGAPPGMPRPTLGTSGHRETWPLGRSTGSYVQSALVTAGAAPETGYNATQGIRKMSGDEAIAEIRAFRAEFQAHTSDFQTLAADVQTLKVDVQVLTTDVQALTAEVRALDAASAGLHAAISDHLDAFAYKVEFLSWVVMATLAMVTFLTATGILAMLGFGPRRRKSKKRGKRRASGRVDSEHAS